MEPTRKPGGITLEYDEANTTVLWGNNGNGINGIDFQWLIPLEGIRSKLKWTFSFHAYFFGCTFFILAFYTFSSILNIRSQISRKRFMSGINTFLCIFGLSRAASLFIDPYGSLKVLPTPITNAVWAIGFPSLMASFCLLQLAFLHLTKLKYGFKLLRTEILLRSVITLHIFTSVFRAVLSSTPWTTTIVTMNYVCELVFLSWSLFLTISFIYIGYQVFNLLNRVPATMLQPDGCQNKGIMQLVMLAPASNLVTSVTAALMPTLLGPAASMTSNQTHTKSGLLISGMTRIEKHEQVKSNSILPKPSKIGAAHINNLKNNEGTQDLNNIRKEGLLKTKKLTWQASITNENNSSELNTTGSKSVLNDAAATKRPILKDTNKAELIKNDDTIPDNITETSKLQTSTTNADINDKAAKENDLLLHTILNHIAYVNRASGTSDSGFAHCSHDATPTSRKKQVRFVLKITYSTAILGLCLTIAEFYQRFGPYGLMKYLLEDDEIKAWPWFAFQTFCRACEIFMSGAIANITKQPAVSIHRYYKHNPAIMKQRGSMFM